MQRLSNLALAITIALSCASSAFAVSQQASSYWDQGVRLYQEGNVSQAINLFKRADQLGHPYAATQIGLCYEQGNGVQQSYSSAAAWYRKAAENGDSLAMKDLGQLYEYGEGIQLDWMAAAFWYQKSANLGNVEGQAALARAYQFGVGVPQSRELAIEWDRRALAQGRQESAHWVRWLSDPTNNIGFYNDEEQNMVIGNRLRTSSELLGADPAGITFHNPSERLDWMRGLRRRVDNDEAEQRREEQIWHRQYHANEVRRLEAEGMDPSEAERRAP